MLFDNQSFVFRRYTSKYFDFVTEETIKIGVNEIVVYRVHFFTMSRIRKRINFITFLMNLIGLAARDL